MLVLATLAAASHALPAVAATAGGNGSPSPAATMQQSSKGGGGGGRMSSDPRKAPPMEPSRKVNEQDCSKPIDFERGNLKCK